MSKVKRTWDSKYNLVSENIGEGGNAFVHKISDKNNNIFAIKVLDLEHTNKEKKERFLQEIRIMSKHSDLDAIMPVLDSSSSEYWYVMPLATPVSDFIKQKLKSFKDIQSILVDIASALCEIHSRDLEHRDIKPENIYFWNGKIRFGDFGLVNFPDNHNNLTKSDRGIGSIFTIAPEMKRYPKTSDGKKADVYSLAKTIWILLTGESKGFDGQYLQTGDYSLRRYGNLKKNHLVELENLLYLATSYYPDSRPNIESFCSELKRWIDVSRNFELRQISEWNFLNKCLFGKDVPDTAVWSDNESIINVLNIVSSLPVYNHMLFSDKGGLDFKSAYKAKEEKCIQIIEDNGNIFVLKPQKLYFERFKDSSWNYFLLVIDKLDPVFPPVNGQYEHLVEDYPGHYVSASYVQYGVYDYDSGEKLPDGFKSVFRYVEGSILFVMKNGFYNGIISTYDGRHGKIPPELFRLYTEKLSELSELYKKIGHSHEKIRFELNYNPTINRFLKGLNNILGINEDNDKKIIKNDIIYADNFIKDHLIEWSFCDITNGLKSANINEFNAVYYIEYQKNTLDISDLADYMKMLPICLCRDGQFKHCNGTEIFYFDSEESAKKAISNCKQIILNKCLNAGYKEDNFNYLRIRFLKGKLKPTHLFSEQEIRELMLKADDRVFNRLVINAEGFARIISGNDIDDEYPVRLEAWHAGNVYVGKYSDLSGQKIAYLCALNGWLTYLKTGKSQSIDYANENNEIKLIEEIMKYY